MSLRRAVLRAGKLAVLCVLTLLVVPASVVRPADISLHRVETAKGVDFSDGRLWALVLGQDAEGLTDAIQLVGIDGTTGSAVGLGIPRDSWLDMPEIGLHRINAAYRLGGADVVSQVVADLTGITPDLVLVVNFDGFRGLMGTLGPVDVRTPQGFVNDGVTVRRGANTFDPGEALAYVRYRKGLDGGDFDRSANHQRLMLSALGRLRTQEDEPGFMEGAALAALAGVETDLGPADLYRLAQFLTTVAPRQVDTCVLPASPRTVLNDTEVVILDEAAARRTGADAQDDLRLQRGCPTV